MMSEASFSEPASLGDIKSLKRRRVSSIITVAKTLTDKQRTTLSLPLLSVYLLLGSFIAALGKVLMLLVAEFCVRNKRCTLPMQLLARLAAIY
jgi:small-conductance mechanosensitive channel